MSKFLLLLALPLLMSPALAAERSLQDLHYMTEEYPPFSYRVNGDVSGFSVEILDQVWAELGIPEQQITLLPWARAYFDLINQDNKVLFGVARTPAREGQFQWACPIIKTRYMLFTNKPDEVKVASDQDLQNYRIGTIRFDVGEQLLLEKLDRKVNISSNVSLSANLEMMEMGRIDLFVYDQRSAGIMIDKLGYRSEDFHAIYHLKDSVTCFAFSRTMDKRLVEQFQGALDKVVATDFYQELLQKYLPGHSRKGFN
jgi:polar amino acid transport system substrate-binding protein